MKSTNSVHDDELNGAIPIEIQRFENIAILGMKNKRTNSLDTMFIRTLYKSLKSLSNDDDVKVIILTSSLRFVFSSGLDLLEKIKMVEKDKIANTLVRQCQMFFALSNLVFNLPKPIIAEVNGITLGLGVQLAITCDWCIVSDLAWFKIPEMTIGGIYPTIPLLQKVGINASKQMLYQCAKIDAEEANRIGLADRIVPHKKLQQETILFAKEIQKIDSISLNYQRQLIKKNIKYMMIQEQREISIKLKQALDRDKVIDFLFNLDESGDILNTY